MKQGTLFDVSDLKEQSNRILKESESADFWDNPEKAQNLMKEKKGIDSKVDRYESLCRKISEIAELKTLIEEEDDKDEAKALIEEFETLKRNIDEFNLETLFTEKYDSNSAILSVHAGTGGVDAMDWAEMLFRMYSRWAEKRGYKVTIADYQDDTEAGIKSATIMVDGENAYGYLRGENGVHRLVRISPFNAAGKRQTSFAAIEVMPEIEDDQDIEIDPDDLKIDTYRSSGAGGQHVNTTDSAIRITHIPTKIVVTCQNERSQHQNRETAMKILKSKLAELKEREHKEDLKELKGDFSLITWGAQIRSYVFQPYTMVKDHRTGVEVGNVNAVMDGDIDEFIKAELRQKEL